MKSPEEVAAARAIFDETVHRLDRFAGGADRSERYATELREWLAERYAEDARFSKVLSVLSRYRSKAGPDETAEACRELLDALRLDVEGPRFEWRSVAEENREAWVVSFARDRHGVSVGATCPVCGSQSLQRYYRAYDSESRSIDGEEFVGRGGLWEWCRSCFSYEHYQALVPIWWPGAAVLDRVPIVLLDHSPEFLERALRIDGA